MSVREIKKHIRSTKEIARITNVLYLLAASRLSKVRKRREQAQRYFKELLHLVSLADANVKKKEISLLTRRPTRNMLYVVITPDMGYCGGLPSTTYVGINQGDHSDNCGSISQRRGRCCFHRLC